MDISAILYQHNTGVEKQNYKYSPNMCEQFDSIWIQ